MKTSADPRHKSRIERIQSLFAYSFAPHQIDDNIKDIVANLPQIDQIIARSAPEWPLGKINKLDLAVLRYSVYELNHLDTPAKVVIDEAVEIGKTYGSENSGSFINGVLGTIQSERAHE